MTPLSPRSLSRFTHLTLAALLLAPLLAPAPAEAQATVSQPPSGGNQKAAVTQYLGPVQVTVEYSSPDVTGPNGEDRKGKIWGELVPYGLVNLGFGTAKESPWRAGANENTVFAVSHDVEVEGKPLAAGRYGLHMIPGPEEWTVIFSKNSTSWGSFFYDPAEDALRVVVKPEKAEYSHWLTYEFTDRELDHTTAALKWENLRVPFRIAVPDIVGLYVDTMRAELRSSAGFAWQSWNAAAQYCLQNDRNLEEALSWAEVAVSLPFVGQENFTTLQTKALLLSKLGRQEESDAVMAKAIDHPTAGVSEIHQYARQLLSLGQKDKALEVFQLNASRFPDTWPTDVGLARGLSALGRYPEALKHAKLALERAPNKLNQDNLASLIEKLEKGEDIN